VLLFAPIPTQSQELTARVGVILTDINDARIVNATVIFKKRSKVEFTAKSQDDGTYTLDLRPGTYTVQARSRGFCTMRRGEFRLTDRSSVQFESQMWVCPSDMRFVESVELEEAPGTRLKPLVLYGKEEVVGKVRRFTGPDAIDDGTRHGRQYPAIITFNLVTLSADQLVYNAPSRIIIASGNVSWRDGSRSGTDRTVKIKLDRSNPRVVPLSK
jgi:hypothetical protein